ncbi:MAG: hypothetical protein KAG56_00275 [Sulfurovaceae bacterium]|nr:hypothetical protein [Sulfurovaceae bacterium]
MYKKTLLLSLIFLINACSEKDKSNISQLINKDDIYHVSLLNTQKAQLIASLETKALLTATYLNPVYTRENCNHLCMEIEDGEYFFVGVFIRDSKTHHFQDKGYSLTLNGAKPLEIKKLEKDDSLRYEMPMVDNWSTYYQVKYPTADLKNFNLLFSSDRFGTDKLSFLKEDN